MRKALMIIPEFLQDPAGFYNDLRRGETLKEQLLRLFTSANLFFAIYGFVTGLGHSWLQALSTAIKMPLLFLITLAFTLPALYFFALALLGVRISLKQAAVVVLSGVGVTAFLLAGLAPVTFFFVLTSSNTAFFRLLAVVFVALSGVIGLFYILRGFNSVERENELALGSLGRALLAAWVLLYGFVGAQMTWRLSPLVGDPEAPFALIQPSRDNFFVDAARAFEEAVGLGARGAQTFELAIMALLLGAVGAIGLVIGAGLRGRPRLNRDSRAAESGAD